MYNDFTPVARQTSHNMIYELIVGYAELKFGEETRIKKAILDYDEEKVSFGSKK